MTLFEAVNALINQRRGLTWYTSINEDAAFINVVSTVKDAISASTFSLPASPSQQSLDTTGNVWLSNVQIENDASTTVDILEIHGAHPWVGITVEYARTGGNYTEGFKPGWTDNDAHKFWVTIGLREALPLKISWQRDPNTWPRSVPRVKVIKVANAE